LIKLEEHSFGKDEEPRGNTTWLNGLKFVKAKRKEGLELKT
jgi:hypothetical protein